MSLMQTNRVHCGPGVGGGSEMSYSECTTAEEETCVVTELVPFNGVEEPDMRRRREEYGSNECVQRNCVVGEEDVLMRVKVRVATARNLNKRNFVENKTTPQLAGPRILASVGNLGVWDSLVLVWRYHPKDCEDRL